MVDVVRREYYEQMSKHPRTTVVHTSKIGERGAGGGGGECLKNIQPLFWSYQNITTQERYSSI